MGVHTAYWPERHLGHSQSQASESKLTQGLRQVWQEVLARLRTSDEPRVWPSRCDDPPTWNAYDPVTGQSINLVSEAELRTWLEELHYHNQQFAEKQQADLKLLWMH